MTAKLYFYYGSMNGSKTTQLIQNAYNYQERKMIPVILKPDIDVREGDKHRVISRIGAEFPATIVRCYDNNHLRKIIQTIIDGHVSVVFVDEVQFLSVDQVRMLEDLVDNYDIPVMCYGLRNSFNNAGFESVDWLLRNADKLAEVKNICFCGAKATHNLMVVNGKPVKESGSSICVGGNELYHAVCRRHFKEGVFE